MVRTAILFCLVICLDHSFAQEPASMPKSHWSPFDWLSRNESYTENVVGMDGREFSITWEQQYARRPFETRQGLHGSIPVLGAIQFGRDRGALVTGDSSCTWPPFRVEQGYFLKILNQFQGEWYRVVNYVDDDTFDEQNFFAKVENGEWKTINRVDFPKQLAYINFDKLEPNTADPDFSGYYQAEVKNAGRFAYLDEQISFWYYILTGKFTDDVNTDFPEEQARAFFETYIKPYWTFTP